ncbi:ThiJ/PfpI [Mycena sp. CBHHK59/15]|nr:ThiJ/PfpI [Mycena sp. CBHHK59/15]
MPAVLFVLTSINKTLTGKPTGWYLPEAAHPYYILAPHATIDFASLTGPNPPLALDSIETFADDADSVKFLADETVKAKLASAKKLADVSAKDYDAILYLASEFFQAGKITSAVCHGPAALVEATDADGKSIFAGRAFTGFSNTEEETFGTVKEIPFLLEDKIVSLGGKYSKAAEPFGANVVVDGNLYTGQNPASAVPLAEAILKALK